MTPGYPLHFTQNAFLYGEQLMPRSWCISFEFAFDGGQAARDDRRVVRAVKQLLDRHEALRHAFMRDPSQVEVEHPDFWWHAYHQMPTTRPLPPRGFARFDSAADFPQVARFRLTKPPFFRLYLAEEREGRFRARFDTHHIVADMWTCHILESELIHLLTREEALPPAPPPYGTFVEADYQEFATGRWEPSLAWWRRLLRDPPDNVWPAETGEAGRAAVMVAIEGARYASLRRRLTELRCTPFMILSAAYARAIGRVYGWDRVTLFVLYFNRRSATLKTVGQFANIVYLPVTLRGAATLAQLVADVGPLTLEIIAHHGHVWMKHVFDGLPEATAARVAGAPPIAIREAISLPLNGGPEGDRGDGTDLVPRHKPMRSGENSLEADILLDFAHTAGRHLNLMLTYDRSRIRDDAAAQVLADVAVAVTTEERSRTSS